MYFNSLIRFALITLFALTGFTLRLTAQTLENHFFGNTVGADILPEHLLALDDGGALITGRTNTPDTGGYHVFLLRTDSLGQVLWQQIYQPGTGFSLAKADDGGFYIGGKASRHIFGPDQGFLMKVSASGDPEWNEYISFGDHSYVTEIIALASGQVAVCGVVNEEGSNASQKVFWCRFGPNGGLAFYQTMDNFETSYAPKIAETNEGNLLLAWEQSWNDMLRCINPNGQKVWERNMTEAFDFVYSSDGTSLLVDSLGAIWIGGGYNPNYWQPDYGPKLLCLNSAGDFKHAVHHKAKYANRTALFKGKNGQVNYWFPDNRFGKLHKVTFNAQGQELSTDSIEIELTRRFKQIAQTDENRLLLLHATPFTQSDIWISPIRKSGIDYTIISGWTIGSGLPYSHEYHIAHCQSLSGGTFVLTSSEGQMESYYFANGYLLKIDEMNRQISRTKLGLVNPGQIQPSTDGGAWVGGYQGFVCKVNAIAEVVWRKQLHTGQLISGPDDDFFILDSKSQPGKFDPIKLYHYDRNGDSIALINIYSKSQPYDIRGAVAQRNNGPLLFGTKLDKRDTTFHNWLIYLDKSGKVVSEILLENKYPFFSFDSQPIQTASGGILIATHQYSTQGINLMHIKDGEVLWSTDVHGSDPDSVYLKLLSIEEVPCKGYVLSFESNLKYTATASTRSIVLYYLDENGQGKDFYTYHPLINQVNADTSFLPGFTFRNWQTRLNQQTYDVLLQTVHFPDTGQINFPAGKLNIMPNPSGSDLCLRYESPEFGQLELEIFDRSGRLIDRVFSQKTETSWEHAYHSNRPAGAYFIRVKIGEKVQLVERWIKVK